MNVRKPKKLKKLNSVEGKIRKVRFTVLVIVNLGFFVSKVHFDLKSVINILNGLKRSCLAKKILKIHAVGKKCQIGTS